MKKSAFIAAGIVAAAILLIVVMVAGINNRAISLEEQISGAEAQINVAEKRRVDLIYNLVDTVTAYQEYEGDTMLAVTEARAAAQVGDADGAMTVLNAVSEQYPELKANENYQQLMTELALTENSIAQYRNNYNEQVKAYNKFVRQFPNSIVLGIMGYAPIETQYTDYDAPEDAPTDLFGERHGDQEKRDPVRCYHRARDVCHRLRYLRGHQGVCSEQGGEVHHGGQD